MYLVWEEMLEAITADNRSDLFIGGSINRATSTITLLRGDLSLLEVPLSAFKPSGIGTKPDFDNFSIIDYGHTVKLGDYEAAADAVLYEFDPKYRRKQDNEQRARSAG